MSLSAEELTALLTRLQPQQTAAPQMPQGFRPQPQQKTAVRATLDDFFAQPTTGWGPAWSWKDKPIGTSYTGVVARPITDSDITQQTDPNGQPLFYADGRPRLVMKVPMNVTPDERHEEGRATWYVQGAVRDELARAMAAAGTTAKVPEPGARITVTLVGERPNRYGTRSKQYSVTYEPPGSKTAPEAPTPTTTPTPTPTAPPEPTDNAVTALASSMVEGLSPEQQQLLAQLVGQSK